MGDNFPIKYIKFWKERKDIYQKFRKHQGVLYFKVFPIKEEVTKEQLMELVTPIIASEQLEKKSDSLEMDEGERTFQVVFNNPQSLTKFIKIMET